MRSALPYRTLALLVAILLPLASVPVEATWSIVICDAYTKEVGIASVTCLDNFDLLAITPVVRVGQGAGAVQAAGDFDGLRRPVIRSGLISGTAPTTILANLASIQGHASRQYGIVDTLGRTVTFTGSANGAFAGGFADTSGDLAYAIQGNVLTGDCVIVAAEEALLTTAGDLPTRLMAAMQAARNAGGDGRCSCSSSNPTSCGCPPASFVKSGHIGYFVIARIGDTDDPLCNAGGCADGNYLYDLNVPFQAPSAPDPMEQLQGLFDLRHAELDGRPDAIASTASLAPAPGGHLLTIAWIDHAGAPVTIPLTVTVEHAAGSAGASGIGAPVDLGGGVFEVFLAAGTDAGYDRLRVIAEDGFRPVVLMPGPAFCADALAGGAPDCDGNGIPDTCDIATGAAADLDQDDVPDACPRFLRGDCNADGPVNLADPIAALEWLFGAPGVEPPCLEACNANGGDSFDLADPVAILGFLFATGTPIPPPFPACGSDPFTTPIGCAAGTFCP
jgi:uncharacterized Ntn-hydrolase superfamily protein